LVSRTIRPTDTIRLTPDARLDGDFACLLIESPGFGHTKVFIYGRFVVMSSFSMRKWWFSLGVCITMCIGFQSEMPPIRPRPQARDYGKEVHAIFATKCASCHGPDLKRPEGRFGYVLDLARIASNPELVIPGHPSESELWALIEHDEMPPPDSPYGTLTPGQKKVIRDWIDEGAPRPSVNPKVGRQNRGLTSSSDVLFTPG
jgi:hypothetical protein